MIDYIAALRRHAPAGIARWERVEKLHLTLKFLGEIETARVADLDRAAAQSATCAFPFFLSIEKTGTFPPRGIPRVLWLDVQDDSKGLSVLHQSLEEACASEGFPREPRSFHPHLTIARLHVSDSTARELGRHHCASHFTSNAFHVTELLVVRSELQRGGSRYTTLSRHPLGGLHVGS